MARIVWLLLLTLWLTACAPDQMQPPISPIIPNNVPVMLNNQWRLTNIFYNGTNWQFDAIQPVLVTFPPGFLSYKACNSGGFFFDTSDADRENAYKLMNGASTARECEDGGTEQESIFAQALLGTNHYEITDDALTFLGDNIRVEFVIDNEAEKPDDWY